MCSAKDTLGMLRFQDAEDPEPRQAGVPGALTHQRGCWVLCLGWRGKDFGSGSPSPPITRALLCSRGQGRPGVGNGPPEFGGPDQEGRRAHGAWESARLRFECQCCQFLAEMSWRSPCTCLTLQLICETGVMNAPLIGWFGKLKLTQEAVSSSMCHLTRDTGPNPSLPGNIHGFPSNTWRTWTVPVSHASPDSPISFPFRV